MRRVLLAVACLFVLGTGLQAASMVHPEHHKERLVAADVPAPPPSAHPEAVPILFVPPTTTTMTTTAPPPPPSTTTEPRPATPRPARARAASPVSQVSPQPVEISGDYVPPEGCMYNHAHPGGQAHACWDALLARYPWSVSTAFSVMMCESEGNPYDINSSSGATGLMQIVLKGASTDPARNMAQAWDKYVGAGHSWGPWVSSRSCWSTKQKG